MTVFKLNKKNTNSICQIAGSGCGSGSFTIWRKLNEIVMQNCSALSLLCVLCCIFFFDLLESLLTAERPGVAALSGSDALPWAIELRGAAKWNIWN